MSLVTLETDGALAVITLDNPPQNRIGERVAAELAAAIETVETGDSRAVLLRARGPDFSFGGDIVDWPDMSVRQLRATFEQYMAVFNRFERLPLPVVAAVQGLCFGGGLELAIRADMIVAAESAQDSAIRNRRSVSLLCLEASTASLNARVGPSRRSGPSPLNRSPPRQ